MLITFRKYAIKPYIPRIWANLLDFLAFKRETDELRFQPMSMSLQKRKTAVEVAATHSDSIQFFIEKDKRSNDYIEFFRAYFITGNRLPNTELISFEPRIALNFHKPHFAVPFDNRNENMLFSLPGSFKNQTCVDFTAGG